MTYPLPLPHPYVLFFLGYCRAWQPGASAEADHSNAQMSHHRLALRHWPGGSKNQPASETMDIDLIRPQAVAGRFRLSEPRIQPQVGAALRTRSGRIYTGICLDLACGIGTWSTQRSRRCSSTERRSGINCCHFRLAHAPLEGRRRELLIKLIQKTEARSSSSPMIDA
jgi:hypothetical protein